MNRVVNILMSRDGITEKKARRLVSQVSEEVTNAIEAGRYDEVEQIMYSELRLEMDYIDDILYV